MPNALVRQNNDLGVYSVPPQTPTDPRVRLAEEDGLQSLISAYQASLSRSPQWLKAPEFTIGDDRKLTVKGQYQSRFYPTNYIGLEAALQSQHSLPKKKSSSEPMFCIWLFLVQLLDKNTTPRSVKFRSIISVMKFPLNSRQRTRRMPNEFGLTMHWSSAPHH